MFCLASSLVLSVLLQEEFEDTIHTSNVTFIPVVCYNQIE